MAVLLPASTGKGGVLGAGAWGEGALRQVPSRTRFQE
jgi:hypothetical protein